MSLFKHIYIIAFLSDEGVEVLCVGDRVTRGPDWVWEDEVIIVIVVRKPVFGVPDQDPHKPGCITTQDG